MRDYSETTHQGPAPQWFYTLIHDPDCGWYFTVSYRDEEIHEDAANYATKGEASSAAEDWITAYRRGDL